MNDSIEQSKASPLANESDSNSNKIKKLKTESLEETGANPANALEPAAATTTKTIKKSQQLQQDPIRKGATNQSVPPKKSNVTNKEKVISMKQNQQVRSKSTDFETHHNTIKRETFINNIEEQEAEFFIDFTPKENKSLVNESQSTHTLDLSSALTKDKTKSSWRFQEANQMSPNELVTENLNVRLFGRQLKTLVGPTRVYDDVS